MTSDASNDRNPPSYRGVPRHGTSPPPGRISIGGAHCDPLPQSATRDGERLREEARRVIEVGALGRSSSYARLLTYLVECTVNGRAPKELEVAVQVFGRNSDFDPTQDAIVRVYAHNLRQKLQNHYSEQRDTTIPRLNVPRGEYRVQLVPAEITTSERDATTIATPPDPTPPTTPENARSLHDKRGVRRAFGAVGLLACGIVLGAAIATVREASPSSTTQLGTSPAWAPLLDDGQPILVVVGDYYIFGERDPSGEVSRLVRDFGINSRKDLDDLMLYEADARGRYLDLSLTYLPAGTAFALRDVFHVAHLHKKPIRVASMSELSAAELKSGHVVYVGYVSALGMLEDFVFASSGLTLGSNYDELRNRETGTLYTSEAGIPGADRNYRDYGFVSTFPGPNGNQLLVIAGTRDAGLMQAAHVLSDPMFLGDIESAAKASSERKAPAFELLYEVTGYGRTNLDAMLVHSAELSYRDIWGGELRREAY